MDMPSERAGQVEPSEDRRDVTRNRRPGTLPTFSLPAAATAIESCLSANASAQVDRIDRIRLEAHSGRLRWWLRVARDKRTVPWCFNEFWNGPALSDVLRDCEGIRVGGNVRKVA